MKTYKVDHPLYLWLVFILIFILLPVDNLHAVAKSWVGTTTSWNTSGNWSPAGVPGTMDDVTIPSGASAYPILTTSATNGVKKVTINGGGSLVINSGGSLTASGDLEVDGTFTINGGSISTNHIVGIGTININGGTVNCQDFKPTGGTHNITGGVIDAHDYKPTRGNTYMSNGVLKISHDWKPNAPSIFVPTGGTVQFTANAGGGAFDPNGTYSFYHVQVDADHPHFEGTIRIYGTLSLNAEIDLPNGIDITADKLRLGGVLQLDGSYGSTSSAAANKNNTYFSGSGILNVNNALPVTLIGFKGIEEFGKAVLTWSAIDNLNNDKFVVERSSDALKFEIVGEIQVNSNNLDYSEYEFIDRKPNGGLNYYRLKQLNQDGKFQFSSVIQVNVKVNNKDVLLFPNPTSETLTLILPPGNTGFAHLAIHDLTGRPVTRYTLDIEKDFAPLRINLNQLPAGIYFMNISTGQNRWREKILVK